MSSAETFEYRIPRATSEKRPVVVGFGPAGMFAALVLAEAGLKPIVLERRLDAVTRRERVKRFWKTGELDQECNVQFGEGGAGTFSDGKLTPARKRAHRLGAETADGGRRAREYTHSAKPHVGRIFLLTWFKT